MPRYYIQVSAVLSQGYDEADTYEDALVLALKYRAEEEAKYPHLGKMWFDIEEIKDEV